MKTQLLFTLTLLAATAPLQAAVYQCTDASGKTAYQGQPCAAAVSKQVVLEAAKPTGTTADTPAETTPRKTVTGKNYYERDQFVGTWCFFVQELDGEKSDEFVTIKLDDSGHYLWSEGQFKQEGGWSYDYNEHTLDLENVGSHKVISASKSMLQLKRYSNMSWRAGSC